MMAMMILQMSLFGNPRRQQNTVVVVSHVALSRSAKCRPWRSPAAFSHFPPGPGVAVATDVPEIDMGEEELTWQWKAW